MPGAKLRLATNDESICRHTSQLGIILARLHQKYVIAPQKRQIHIRVAGAQKTQCTKQSMFRHACRMASAIKELEKTHRESLLHVSEQVWFHASNVRIGANVPPKEYHVFTSQSLGPPVLGSSKLQ